MPVHKYNGWKPDVPDRRDRIFKLTKQEKSLLAKKPLPDLIDLRPEFPKTYNQLSINACVGNAVGGAFQYEAIVENIFGSNIMPSRLFIYYNARKVDGLHKVDEGATIRGGIKALVRYGACSAPFWPYVIKNVNVLPPKRAYDEAKKRVAIEYGRVNRNLDDIRTCLAGKYAIICGISIYESFESEQVTKTGMVPMPAKGESLLGGHAVVIVGFDHKRKLFICRNSWGEEWGDSGYFYLPYDYMLDSDNSDDFWTLRDIS